MCLCQACLHSNQHSHLEYNNHVTKPTSKGMRHEQECEAPVPVYVGMKLQND